MHACGMQREPQQNADCDVGPHAVNARAVEQRKSACQCHARHQCTDIQVRGIEQRDHGNGTDVVDDGSSRQEHAQFDRHARAQHHDERHREGGVRGHGHTGPKVPARPPCNGQIQQRGQQHAAQRRGNG